MDRDPESDDSLMQQFGTRLSHRLSVTRLPPPPLYSHVRHPGLPDGERENGLWFAETSAAI